MSTATTRLTRKRSPVEMLRVGVFTYPAYTVNEKRWLSLAVVEAAQASTSKHQPSYDANFHEIAVDRVYSTSIMTEWGSYGTA